ncbi:MAG: LON peptidase substrate-binding domain-containing protein [Rhodothermales bacterium]|nr:LON peptidase substrate-binding domain-containing protein [Rhodothermales bacterium]
MPFPHDDLPRFPLNVVLYPGESIPLHIFEERYREMVRYCLETRQPFGLVLAQEDELARVGCTARIDRVLQRYEDGRSDILVVGEERFRLEEVRQERLYLTARAVPYDGPEQPVDLDERERVVALHMKLLELAGETLRPHVYEGPKRVSYVIAQNAGLDLERKQEVLELETEEERLAYLASYLEQVIPEVERARERQRRIRSNGHFSNGSGGDGHEGDGDE